MAVKIVLIEDNDFDAELTLRSLNEFTQNDEIVRFADGPKALEFLFQANPPGVNEQKSNPKLILLDLKLGAMSGIDVLAAIRNNARTQFIPVVMLTSSAMESDIKTCYKLGANSYLTKPVHYDAYLTAIRSLAIYWLQINQPC